MTIDKNTLLWGTKDDNFHVQTNRKQITFALAKLKITRKHKQFYSSVSISQMLCG